MHRVRLRQERRRDHLSIEWDRFVAKKSIDISQISKVAQLALSTAGFTSPFSLLPPPLADELGDPGKLLVLLLVAEVVIEVIAQGLATRDRLVNVNNDLNGAHNTSL
jgi:hypothetical protein